MAQLWQKIDDQEDSQISDFNENLGVILKQARLDQNLSYDQIALKLCIQHSYITAIEEGRFQDLPSEPYRTGFIKSYASFLRLDTDYLVAEYRRHNEVRDQVYNFPEPIREIKSPKKRWIFWVLVILLTAFLISEFFLTSNPDSMDFITTIPERLLS